MTSDGVSTPATARSGQSHLDVIRRLQELIDRAMVPSLPGLIGGSYVLLDMPDHGNVGDSAIWAGEVAWLRANVPSDPDYVCEHQEPHEKLAPEIAGKTILLHGGGNFGDIWPSHQEFRERIIQGQRGQNIVQFPQSLHFGNDRALQTTATALRDAKHFRLLVRDHESFDLATANFNCEVTLCPDMAFALGPLQKIGPRDLKVLLLLRTDKESLGTASSDFSLPSDWWATDWLEDEPDLHRDALRETRLSAVLGLSIRKLTKRSRRNTYYNLLAQKRLDRGVKLLSRAEFIITDRLHVHILSTLLGIPHCYLDNSYGKISRFSDAFDTRWTGSFWAQTLKEAVSCANAWFSQTDGQPIS